MNLSPRARVLAFVGIVVALVAAAGVYVLTQGREVRAQRQAEPEAVQTPVTDVVDGPRIVFRHTGIDNELGVVAMVPLDDPGGARAFTGVSCDRVAARPEGASCLTIDRGVVTTYESHSYDADWQEVDRSGRLWTRDDVLDEIGPIEPVGFEVVSTDRLGPDTILLLWRTSTEERSTLRSTLWLRSGGQWQARFHQGTDEP